MSPRHARHTTTVSARLPAETIRQLDALCAKWDDSRSGAIQRTIERIYNLEIRDFENKDTAK